MKKIIVVCVFILSICLWVYYVQAHVIQNLINKNTSPTNTSSGQVDTLVPEQEAAKTQDQINKELVQEKIEKIKKRLALKWLIAQGDEYFQNDQLTAALKNYLQAYKRNPQDEQIIKKLADTYFEMHRFEAAVRHYKELLSSENFDKNTLALATMYAWGVWDIAEKSQLISQLEDIDLDPDEYFYYETAIACLSDFHNCKIAYDEYKKELDIQGNPQEIQSENLEEIKKAIESYRNFQVDQVYFKNALIVGAFYTNKNYPIAIELGKKLLEEKGDYKPIIKIVADSYFELGDYENAKTYLSAYYKNDNTDGGIAYLLWVIHSEEWDYVLSNIYLNKALENGYTPTLNIRRKLVYNYFLLESWENIIRSFYDLIEEEEDYEKSDLELAIYYYILYEEYDQAKIWIQTGMEKYPTEENFHGYLGWIRYEQENTDLAKQEIQKWLEINDKNAFLNYNMGRIEKETWNTGVSLIYFKRVIKNAPTSQFAVAAKQEIESLQNDNN